MADSDLQPHLPIHILEKNLKHDAIEIVDQCIKLGIQVFYVEGGNDFAGVDRLDIVISVDTLKTALSTRKVFFSGGEDFVLLGDLSISLDNSESLRNSFSSSKGTASKKSRRSAKPAQTLNTAKRDQAIRAFAEDLMTKEPTKFVKASGLPDKTALRTRILNLHAKNDLLVKDLGYLKKDIVRKALVELKVRKEY